MKKKLVFFAMAFLLLTIGVYGQTTQTCTRCNGKGTVDGEPTINMRTFEVSFPQVRCTTCNGTGRITVAAPTPTPAPAQNNQALAQAAYQR